MRNRLLVAPTLLLLASSGLTAAPRTPFELGDQGGVIVPVRLNDAGPFMVLLDTGSTHTAITATVAATIGAAAVATTTVGSPIGESRRTIVGIDRFEIGSTASVHVLATVVPDRSFDDEGRIQGLIGQDVLAGRRFTIDFERHHVQWHGARSPRHGVTLRLSPASGRFLVDVPQQGEPLRLVPDSGAGGLVLFTSPAHERPWAHHTGRTVQVETATGRDTAMEVRLARFQVGDRTFRDIPAVAIARPPRDLVDGDGLLPLHLFRRVTFDGPQRILCLG